MEIGGICYLKIDGVLTTIGEGDCTYGLGSHKREPVMGSGGVVGWTAKPQEPFCEVTFLHTKDLDVQKILNIVNATVTLELYNQKTFVLHNAFFSGEGEISSNGEFKARFTGLKGELI